MHRIHNTCARMIICKIMKFETSNINNFKAKSNLKKKKRERNSRVSKYIRKKKKLCITGSRFSYIKIET